MSLFQNSKKLKKNSLTLLDITLLISHRIMTSESDLFCIWRFLASLNLTKAHKSYPSI